MTQRAPLPGAYRPKKATGQQQILNNLLLTTLYIAPSTAPFRPYYLENPKKKAETFNKHSYVMILYGPIDIPIQNLYVEHKRKISPQQIEIKQGLLQGSLYSAPTYPLFAAEISNPVRRQKSQQPDKAVNLLQTTLFASTELPLIRFHDQPNPTKRGATQHFYTWENLQLTKLAQVGNPIPPSTRTTIIYGPYSVTFKS